MSNETREIKAIKSLLAAMRRWGAMEDGILDEYGIAAAYNAAASVVGEKPTIRDEIMSDETMSNEHDDEVRESIPCVSFAMHEDGSAITVCLPVGYSLDSEGGVFYRGQRVSTDGGERCAWDHAVAREKARRQLGGELPPPRKAVPIPPGEDTAQYLIRERDKAAAMLADVIRERDELKGTLDDALHDRDMVRAEYKEVLLERDDALYRVIRERDELRAKLEQVRGVQRLALASMRVVNGRAAVDWIGDEDGPYVRWDDLAAIIGKDGEA